MTFEHSFFSFQSYIINSGECDIYKFIIVLLHKSATCLKTIIFDEQELMEGFHFEQTLYNIVTNIEHVIRET